MARSMAMTFLALSLFLVPVLAYGADDSTEFGIYYDEALAHFVDEIDRSQHEGSPFEPEVLACLHKEAQQLAAKVAHLRMAQLHGQTPEHDSDVDGSEGWDKCFNQH